MFNETIIATLSIMNFNPTQLVEYAIPLQFLCLLLVRHQKSKAYDCLRALNAGFSSVMMDKFVSRVPSHSLSAKDEVKMPKGPQG